MKLSLCTKTTTKRRHKRVDNSSSILNRLYGFYFCIIHGFQKGCGDVSPYNQQLPECNASFKFPSKQSAQKGIVCALVKDEQGFLSEFVAYYVLQGFEHIIFYDNNSSQNLDELDPWIKIGFVTVKNATTVWNKFQYREIGKRSQASFDLLYGKKSLDMLNAVIGIDCKLQGINEGYSIYLGVDVDEYTISRNSEGTLFDDLINWFNYTTNRIAFLHRFNFPSTPHILEPVNLLTIEAYQTRYPVVQKMNYYATTGPKLAILLSTPMEQGMEGNELSSTQAFLARCCFIHGCGCHHYTLEVIQIDQFNCTLLFKNLYSDVWAPKKQRKTWKQPPIIHHYARSLEKFALKQKLWDPKLASGNDSIGNPQGLSVYSYLHRSVGHNHLLP